MMTNEGSTKIVTLMTSRSYKSYYENVIFFLLFSLYSRAWIRQIKYKVMVTKEGSTKIVNFMTRGVGVFVLGRWGKQEGERG